MSGDHNKLDAMSSSVKQIFLQEQQSLHQNLFSQDTKDTAIRV